VDRPKAETMEHLEITQFTLTAKPALDTMIDDHGHVLRHPHSTGAGPSVAQRGLARAEGTFRDEGDVGRGGRRTAPLPPPSSNQVWRGLALGHDRSNESK
jgi:hypothetical protein